MSERNPAKLLRAAAHALRSYQYGNASPDLAQEVADAIDEALSDITHRAEIRLTDWSIEHPVQCRENGSLLDCPVERAMNVYEDPPVAFGRYRVTLGDGGLSFVREEAQ